VVHALWQNRRPESWPATGLEWETASPPLTENFNETPVVDWEPYDFVHRPDLGLSGAKAPGKLAPGAR